MTVKELLTDLENLGLGECQVVTEEEGHVYPVQLTVKVIHKMLGAKRQKFVAIEFEELPEVEVETIYRRGLPLTRRLSMARNDDD